MQVRCPFIGHLSSFLFVPAFAGNSPGSIPSHKPPSPIHPHREGAFAASPAEPPPEELRHKVPGTNNGAPPRGQARPCIGEATLRVDKSPPMTRLRPHIATILVVLERMARTGSGTQPGIDDLRGAWMSSCRHLIGSKQCTMLL